MGSKENKKGESAQDIFFGFNGRISLVDPFPHRGKEPIDARAFSKAPKLKCSENERSDKGFPNSFTCPIGVVDKKKRDELESKIDIIGVFVDTDEGLVFCTKDKIGNLE